MKLTPEEGRHIVWGEEEGWTTIEGPKLVSQSRWSIYKAVIVRHDVTGKYYRIVYSEGATECQDEGPFEHSEPELVEVHQVERIVKVWEAV